MIKKTLFYTLVVGLFAIPFIPFIIANQMYFPFIVGKGFAFRILIEVVFGLYLALAIISPEYRPKMSWITKSVTLFIVAIFVSDLLSANPYKSFWSNYERMEGFVLLIHLALYYIVASSVFLTKDWWQRWFNFSIGASVVMSFYGLLQLMGKLPINQGGVRLDATLGNASYLAIYLVFNIFLCSYFLSSSNQNWKKWVYGSIALFEAIMLYYTATRGAILGLIVGLFLSAILVVWKERENKNIRKISYGVIIAVVLLVGGFAVIRNASFIKSSPVLSRFSTLGPTELSTQGRYYVWPMAVKGFLERPIFGWGQESFNFVFNKYYDPAMYSQEQWFDRTHDIVLDWLIAGGLVGFLSYMSIYFCLIWLIWKKGNFSLTEKSILYGMIFAYFFNNIFVFDNLVSYIMFFSILAFVHSRSTENNHPTGSFYTKTFSSDALNYGFFPLIAILTVASVYFVNVPAINANFQLIKAMSSQDSAGGLSKNLNYFKSAFAENSFGSSEVLEQLVAVSGQVIPSSQVPTNIKNDFAIYTDQKLKEKIANTPNDTRYLVFAGGFYGSVGQYDSALNYFDEALKINPNKQSILFQVGSTYLNQKKYDKAFEVAKLAYDLAPSFDQAKIFYAIVAIYSGRQDIAKQMFSLLPKDSIESSNQIVQTYVNVGDYGGAIDILTSRLEKSPNDTQTKLNLVYVYAKSGQKSKAISILEQMISQDPSFKAQGENYIKQVQAL